MNRVMGEIARLLRGRSEAELSVARALVIKFLYADRQTVFQFGGARARFFVLESQPVILGERRRPEMSEPQMGRRSTDKPICIG